MKQYLLFDLDGTLTDSREGIITCVQYALGSFGIEEPDRDKLECFIGPPLADSFMEYYGMTPKQAQEATEKYRERYAKEGMFENELYPGIHDLLRSLKAGGMHLAVASSKPTVYVEQILKHFQLDGYFEEVVGSELDGTRTKKIQVIHEVLQRFFGEKPIAYDQVYVIGDRKYDIEGAKALHIESVGVTYGYGSLEELKEAKADYIVRSVTELKTLLMREVEEAKRASQQGKAMEKGKRQRTPQMQAFWAMILPFILFLITKVLINLVALMVIQTVAASFGWQDAIYIYDENGDAISYTGLANALGTIIGTFAAGLAVLRYARVAVQKDLEENKLSHLKKEPVKNYLLLLVVVVGAVIGLNILMNISGLIDTSATYQSVVNTQYSVPLVVGLLSYGLLTPLAEELMFRGIIYTGLKKLFKLPAAMVVSALFFGYYHGNSVQLIYGFVLGFIMAYAYEFFGDFKIPVAIHMLANILAYCMTYTGLAQTAFMDSAVVCGIACAAMVVAAIFLVREKKIL